MLRPPLRSTLFPYTTLFRSLYPLSQPSSSPFLTVAVSDLFGTQVEGAVLALDLMLDRKSTRLNSSHVASSYAVFCLKKKMCHLDVYWFVPVEHPKKDADPGK